MRRCECFALFEAFIELACGVLTNHFAACSLQTKIGAIRSGVALEATHTEAGPEHNDHILLKRLVRECHGFFTKVTKLDLQVRPFKLLAWS